MPEGQRKCRLSEAGVRIPPHLASAVGQWCRLSSRICRPGARIIEVIMDLYVIRHADAGKPEGWDGDDVSRPLTSLGHQQANALGEAFRQQGLSVDAILTSPLTRTMQTATDFQAAAAPDGPPRSRPIGSPQTRCDDGNSRKILPNSVLGRLRSSVITRISQLTWPGSWEPSLIRFIWRRERWPSFGSRVIPIRGKAPCPGSSPRAGIWRRTRPNLLLSDRTQSIQNDRWREPLPR